MAFEARLVHGEPRMVDHRPAAAVNAGTVVISGLSALIAHRDLEAGALAVGALGAGGGVYEALCDAALAINVACYWDNTAKRVTATAAANTLLGRTKSATTAADQLVWFHHHPQ